AVVSPGTRESLDSYGTATSLHLQPCQSQSAHVTLLLSSWQPYVVLVLRRVYDTDTPHQCRGVSGDKGVIRQLRCYDTATSLHLQPCQSQSAHVTLLLSSWQPYVVPVLRRVYDTDTPHQCRGVSGDKGVIRQLCCYDTATSLHLQPCQSQSAHVTLLLSSWQPYVVPVLRRVYDTDTPHQCRGVSGDKGVIRQLCCYDTATSLHLQPCQSQSAHVTLLLSSWQPYVVPVLRRVYDTDTPHQCRGVSGDKGVIRQLRCYDTATSLHVQPCQSQSAHVTLLLTSWQPYVVLVLHRVYDTDTPHQCRGVSGDKGVIRQLRCYDTATSLHLQPCQSQSAHVTLLLSSWQPYVVLVLRRVYDTDTPHQCRGVSGDKGVIRQLRCYDTATSLHLQPCQSQSAHVTLLLSSWQPYVVPVLRRVYDTDTPHQCRGVSGDKGVIRQLRCYDTATSLHLQPCQSQSAHVTLLLSSWQPYVVPVLRRVYDTDTPHQCRGVSGDKGVIRQLRCYDTATSLHLQPCQSQSAHVTLLLSSWQPYVVLVLRRVYDTDTPHQCRGVSGDKGVIRQLRCYDTATSLHLQPCQSQSAHVTLLLSSWQPYVVLVLRRVYDTDTPHQCRGVSGDKGVIRQLRCYDTATSLHLQPCQSQSAHVTLLLSSWQPYVVLVLRRVYDTDTPHQCRGVSGDKGVIRQLRCYDTATSLHLQPCQSQSAHVTLLLSSWQPYVVPVLRRVYDTDTPHQCRGVSGDGFGWCVRESLDSYGATIQPLHSTYNPASRNQHTLLSYCRLGSHTLCRCCAVCMILIPLISVVVSPGIRESLDSYGATIQPLHSTYNPASPNQHTLLSYCRLGSHTLCWCCTVCMILIPLISVVVSPGTRESLDSYVATVQPLHSTYNPASRNQHILPSYCRLGSHMFYCYVIITYES
ncbi:hypothetical protein J6590_005754, partial [Homalodisca vitripennis]